MQTIFAIFFKEIITLSAYFDIAMLTNAQAVCKLLYISY